MAKLTRYVYFCIFYGLSLGQKEKKILPTSVFKGLCSSEESKVMVPDLKNGYSCIDSPCPEGKINFFCAFLDHTR